MTERPVAGMYGQVADRTTIKGRAQSARGRQVDRRKYSWSKYGHIEPLDVKIQIRSVSGTLFLVTWLHDYSYLGALYERLSHRVTIIKTRLRILWGEVVLDGWQCDRHHHPNVCAFKLFQGRREVSLTFAVMNVFPCEDCGKEALLSGWCSCVTGLPEMHLPCGGCDQYWRYMEYGYRGLRLWRHLTRVALCRIR